MQFETLAAVGTGIVLSASLPGMAQQALSKVGLNLDLTSGYRAGISSIVLAGTVGYASYSLLGLKPATASAFTVAMMVPAAMSILNQAGLSFIPNIISQPTGGLSGFSLAGILGNAPSVIEEPMFGGYHDGMHAGMHAGMHSGMHSSGEMFGLAGKEINLF